MVKGYVIQARKSFRVHHHELRAIFHILISHFHVHLFKVSAGSVGLTCCSGNMSKAQTRNRSGAMALFPYMWSHLSLLTWDTSPTIEVFHALYVAHTLQIRYEFCVPNQ